MILQLDRTSTKNPQHLKNNVFLIYSPETVVIEPADSTKSDTNIFPTLTKKGKAVWHQNSEVKKSAKLTNQKKPVGRNIEYFLLQKTKNNNNKENHLDFL